MIALVKAVDFGALQTFASRASSDELSLNQCGLGC